MDSPCFSCEFRTRSKKKCINLNKYCIKILKYQSELNKTDTYSQSPEFDGSYSKPSTGKKGYRYDFD